MSNAMFWLQPVFAAFTGWFVIWLAINMFFKALPKAQRSMAAATGKLAAAEFAGLDIAGMLNNGDQLKNLTPYIESHLDNFLQVKLQERLPVIAMFVSGDMLNQVKAGMLEEIESLLPQLITQYAAGLSDKLDVEKMITDKIAAIPADRLRALITSALGKQLRMLQFMGLGIGFLIGLVQMGLSML